VTEANSAIVDDPAKVNADPEGEAWFVKLKLSNAGELSGLMDKAAYDKFCAAQ
jgi:glycine cleavage system H protein